MTMGKFRSIIKYPDGVHSTLKSRIHAVYDKYKLSAPVDYGTGRRSVIKMFFLNKSLLYV